MSQRIEISAPAITVMVACMGAGLAGTFLTRNNLPLVFGILTGFFFLFSIKVVRQWEKVAVLRFGRFQRLQGPGVFMLTPVVDTLSSYVDQPIHRRCYGSGAAR